MKRKITAFIVFFIIGFSGLFAQEQNNSRTLNRVMVNREIIKLILDSKQRLDELHYFISEPLLIIIDDNNTIDHFEIRNGVLMFSDEYMSSMVIQINTNHTGRLHVYYDHPIDIEGFDIIYLIQGRYVTLRFSYNIIQNNFILYSAIINGRPYQLRSDIELPILMINSNLNLR